MARRSSSLTELRRKLAFHERGAAACLELLRRLEQPGADEAAISAAYDQLLRDAVEFEQAQVRSGYRPRRSRSPRN